MVSLSLAFDHRIVDRSPAAVFLKAVREFVEQPTLWREPRPQGSGPVMNRWTYQ